jgi:hypothetical protein
MNVKDKMTARIQGDKAENMLRSIDDTATARTGTSFFHISNHCLHCRLHRSFHEWAQDGRFIHRPVAAHLPGIEISLRKSLALICLTCILKSRSVCFRAALLGSLPGFYES